MNKHRTALNYELEAHRRMVLRCYYVSMPHHEHYVAVQRWLTVHVPNARYFSLHSQVPRRGIKKIIAALSDESHDLPSCFLDVSIVFDTRAWAWD